MTDYGLITGYDPFAHIAAESVALADAADGNSASKPPAGAVIIGTVHARQNAAATAPNR